MAAPSAGCCASGSGRGVSAPNGSGRPEPAHRAPGADHTLAHSHLCGTPRPHHPPAPSAGCCAIAVAVGASQRQTVAVGPSRPTGPLGPSSPPPFMGALNRPPLPDASRAVSLTGFNPAPEPCS
eukprot:scaffold64646_cov63-Phaeocystis_antarctica.AAC.1